MRSCGASLAAALALLACCALAAAPGGSEGDAPAAPTQRREPTMHTVFSAECTPYFDWQSIALVRSHKLARRCDASGQAPLPLPARRRSRPPRRQVGIPGPITRLLACDQDRLQRCGPRCAWRATRAALVSEGAASGAAQLQVRGHRAYARAPQLR
jgi:hypothetical protein